MLQLIQSIQAHSDKVWSVSAHPTLPLLATASTDKSTKVYKLSSVSSFPQIANLEDTHRRSVRSVSFKPPIGGLKETDRTDRLCVSSRLAIWGKLDTDDSLYTLVDLSVDAVAKSGSVGWADTLHTLSE